MSGSTTAIEQIVGWNAELFGEFVKSDDNKYIPGQAEVLKIIQKELELEQMNGICFIYYEIEQVATLRRESYVD